MRFESLSIDNHESDFTTDVQISAKSACTIILLATVLSFLFCLAYIKSIEPRYPNSSLGQALQVHVPGVAGRGLIYDENDYVRGAMNLAQGDGYALKSGKPTALRQPLYSIYLAAAFKLSTVSVGTALLANALMVSLMPLLAFLIAKPLFGRTAGVIAALIILFNPSTYYFGVGSIYSEAMFGALLCGATAMWLHARLSTEHALILAIVAGILYGAASLTRSGYLFLPLGLCTGEILMRAPRKNLRAGALMCVMALLTLTPWVVRNQLVMGSPIISSTNDGTTLLGSVLAARAGRGDWVNPAAVSSDYARIQFMPDEVQRTKISRQIAMALLRHINPVQLATIAAKRIARVWAPVTRIMPDEVGRRTNIVLSIVFLPVMLVAGFGVLMLLRSGSAIVYRALPLWMTALYCTAISAAVWGSTRFRFPLEPMLAAVAGFGFVSIRELVGRTEHTTSEVSMAA